MTLLYLQLFCLGRTLLVIVRPPVDHRAVRRRLELGGSDGHGSAVSLVAPPRHPLSPEMENSAILDKRKVQRMDKLCSKYYVNI